MSPSSSLPLYFCAATSLLIFIGQGTQLTHLSFNSEDPSQITQERSIQVASGLRYTIRCGKIGGFESDSPVWFRDGSLVSLNASESIYAIMPDELWHLTIANFSASDVGRYSCMSSGKVLTLDISPGKLGSHDQLHAGCGGVCSED